MKNLIVRQFFKTPFLLIILFCSTVNAQAYFTKDRLQFKNNNAWVPTLNGTQSAIQFSGSVLTLKDGTTLDSADKNVLHYVAPFVGAIMAFSLSSTQNIPASWLVCDGREVKKSTYPILYNAIGDLWGTPIDPANFKLPDLRNFFLRGADNFGTAAGAAGIDTQQRFNTTSFTGTNISSNKTGSYQRSNIVDHSHTLSIAQSTNSSTATHTHTISKLLQNTPILPDEPEGGEGFNNYANDVSTQATSRGTATGPVGPHTHTMTFTQDSSFAGNTNSSGLPKRIFLIYCIKYEPI
jgi:microcystin-dependent protein